jgi:hypothetical protein
MKPKPQRRKQDGEADNHADDHDRRRYPARRRQYRRHFGLRGTRLGQCATI